MRNFSIIPNSSQSTIEQYSDFLTREVYSNMQAYDVNDPLFLQQLGVLQAEGIRRAINDNSAVAYSGFQETNATIANSADFIGNKIGSVANMLTSSLDNGFATLNNSLVKIDDGIQTANIHLFDINRGINVANTHLSNINTGIQNVSNNLEVLGKLIGQGFSRLRYMLAQTNSVLNDILRELKISETQRERRYHIEEGTKFLTLALQNGDNRYFEDAFEKFNNALTFEKKDWYSWFNIGVIHLRSKGHINPQKSIDALSEAVHYGKAEILYNRNVKLEHKIEEIYLLLAESYYLQKKYNEAILETQRCLHLKDKADFMKVKYLSATNESANKQEATKILSKLIEQNPYITLQVLGDDDILRNELVIDLLEECRNKAIQQARTLLQQCKTILLSDSDVKNEIEKIESLVQQNTYLDAIEAIKIIEDKNTWRIYSDLPKDFEGSIIEFLKLEHTTIKKAKELLAECEIKLKREYNNDIEIIWQRGTKLEQLVDEINEKITEFSNSNIQRHWSVTLPGITINSVEVPKRVIKEREDSKSWEWDSFSSYMQNTLVKEFIEKNINTIRSLDASFAQFYESLKNHGRTWSEDLKRATAEVKTFVYTNIINSRDLEYNNSLFYEWKENYKNDIDEYNCQVIEKIQEVKKLLSKEAYAQAYKAIFLMNQEHKFGGTGRVEMQYSLQNFDVVYEKLLFGQKKMYQKFYLKNELIIKFQIRLCEFHKSDYCWDNYIRQWKLNHYKKFRLLQKKLPFIYYDYIEEVEGQFRLLQLNLDE